MADSGAMRQRRSKAHKSGDHSLCGSRCSMGRSSPPVLTILPALAAEATPQLDPVAELRELATELHAAYRQDPGNAMLARECRSTLALLMPKDAGKADADLTGLLKALG